MTDRLGAPGKRVPAESEPLTAALEISFDYTRSLGPVLTRFMTALADHRILAARAADGRVHAPPFEYDPVTSAPPAELIEVGPDGTVISWSWMQDPLEGQPLGRPFGWALVRLDGAGYRDVARRRCAHAGPDADRHAGAAAVGGDPGPWHDRYRLLRALPASGRRRAWLAGRG